MPLIFLILLLLLPLLDIYFAVTWLFESPVIASLYFLATTVLGIFLMKFAKVGFGEMMRLLQNGVANPRLLAGFAGFWVAGALLFFPGYFSDIVAVLFFILAWRAPTTPQSSRKNRFGGTHFGFAQSETHEASPDGDTNEQSPLEAEVEIIDERRD
ncbi:MAG: FxsA family protein [Gammaproteobacteria bacterium WSBS_2016_MAG_OTU1]